MKKIMATKVDEWTDKKRAKNCRNSEMQRFENVKESKRRGKADRIIRQTWRWLGKQSDGFKYIGVF